MNARVSPITSSDIENGPRDRLKAFEAAFAEAFAKLNDDPAYQNSDMDLARLFVATECAVEELVRQCRQYLDHGPVGIWPKSGAPFSEWNA